MVPLSSLNAMGVLRQDDLTGGIPQVFGTNNFGDGPLSNISLFFCLH